MPRKSLHQQGMDIQNLTSIYLKVNTSGVAWISLQEKIASTIYKVYNVILKLEQIAINNIFEKQRTSVTWSELQSNCYVSLWVSWIGGTIEVGGGSEIGTNKLIHLPINHSIVVTDILIWSYYTAYWLFDFQENATSAYTTDCTDGALEIDPETLNTTETALPGFVLTTISKKDTTTSGFDPTSINTTETTTSGFDPTSINTTETTTSEFDPTSINTTETTETTTSGFDPTSIKTTETTETTTSGFDPTLISTTETATSGFDPTSIKTTETTETTTPGVDSTSINTTETTTSGFDPTSIMTTETTETTTPGVDPTSINTTETTTLGVDPTSINRTETTTPEFYPTSINTTVTTTPELFPISINTTASSTPGLYLTSTNTTETTTPELFPTTISTTETTSPGYNPTTISKTETTTQGFAPTSIGMVTATTSGTTKNIETPSTKKSCICPCNNSTMTENELIRKIALLKSELSVDKKLTTKYKRSLVSASDDRPSSKYIGNFGIVVLVVICSLIVLMDFHHCAPFVFHKKK
ncbi:unnamed protein product [Mytilus edulis]|uniref:Uncharacterized protein n=1 Tax=Mytilus edulis TaxID=6550 RepID=A0A8S3UIP8_MYTED|nr:unnamed protein product [Mytilus edulis]